MTARFVLYLPASRRNAERTPEKSDRQIAAGLGVSQTTVGTQRKSMKEIGQLSKLDSSIGLDGKERPRQVQRKPVSVFNPSKREERAMQSYG